MIRRPAPGLARAAIALALVLLSAASFGLCASTRAEAANPPLTVKPSTATVGQVIYASATGLSTGALYQVQVCGRNYSDGSVDCASDASATSRVDAKGLLAAFLRVPAPPVQCPCVVVATPFTLGTPLTTPIAIEGMSSTIPQVVQTAPASGIVVIRSSFSSSTPMAEWFGLSGTRNLELTLHNKGTTTVSGLRAFGDFGDTPALSQPLASLAGGASRTYVVSVSLPAFSIGKEEMQGRVVTGDGQVVNFKTGATVWPFGLLLVAIVILQIILVAGRNILRRRHRRRNPPPRSDEVVTAEVPVYRAITNEQVASV